MRRVINQIQLSAALALLRARVAAVPWQAAARGLL
jgi:hypothetical protein